MISDPGPSDGTPKPAPRRTGVRVAAAGLGIGMLVVWFSGGFSMRTGMAEDPLLRSIVENLGRGVILPGYRKLAVDAGRLRAAAEAFEREPGAGRLEDLRAAWREARRTWNACEAHFVGPESRRLLRAKVDAVPPLTDKIEEIVLGAEEISGSFVERLGSNRKGFAAIEYLCFDGDGPPSLAALTEGPKAGRRRRLLSALASNLEATVAEIRDGWEPDKGNYLEAFLQGRSADPPSAKASIDLLVNHLVSFTEFVKEERLAKPMGRRPGTSGAPRADLVESRRSANSIEDLLNDLRGIQALYNGGAGDGLSAGVLRANAETHRAIAVALDRALADVSAIRPPLDRSVGGREESALKALSSVVELHLRVASDLPAVYRTRVTVVRFDGD